MFISETSLSKSSPTRSAANTSASHSRGKFKGFKQTNIIFSEILLSFPYYQYTVSQVFLYFDWFLLIIKCFKCSIDHLIDNPIIDINHYNIDRTLHAL